MHLFHSPDNAIFETIYGKRTYVLCKNYSTTQGLSNYVVLKKIPTEKQAKILMELVDLTQTNLIGNFNEIAFSKE